ncbi:MAG: amidophosphoribosyltransferase [Candidatus Liptonbacteria bacterium]|nr:amidophosphoribosyltransferase [Candidatus Liptonbacteria bacterium]
MELTGEKCAVFAVFGRGLEVSRLSFFGLFSLQHRGQESSGIATADGETIRVHKSAGLVASIYSEENIRDLAGHIAIGHNRYSTSLGTGNHHAQPIIEENFAFAHNGNLPSVRALKDFFSKKDMDVSALNDSELMARTISHYFKNGVPIEEAVRNALPLFTGAYCLVIMTKDALVAVRDQCGIRPLSMARLNGGFVFASESCAFKTIGAEFMREIAPGEMIVVDARGMRHFQVLPQNPKLDIFEFVYFARPDSNILGKSVYEVRRNLGVRLAKEFPLDADIVVPVPDTAIPSAIGYANTLGIPFEMALVKNRYIHRTFIEPDQRSRDLGVKMKLSPLPEVLNGKRVVVIDDSIVRGTTSRQIVKTLFEAGSKEVHFLVCSPPIQYPDFYGIDISEQTKLIAFHKTVEEIRKYLGATSLYYLSLQGMVKATGLPEEVFSLSCFNGDYPIALHERVNDFEQSKVVEPAAGTLFGE